LTLVRLYGRPVGRRIDRFLDRPFANRAKRICQTGGNVGFNKPPHEVFVFRLKVKILAGHVGSAPRVDRHYRAEFTLTGSRHIVVEVCTGKMFNSARIDPSDNLRITAGTRGTRCLIRPGHGGHDATRYANSRAVNQRALNPTEGARAISFSGDFAHVGPSGNGRMPEIGQTCSLDGTTISGCLAGHPSRSKPSDAT